MWRDLQIQSIFLILLLLENIVGWVLFTLSTTCFIEAVLGRDVEHQNTHIVLFKSAGELMQIGRLSAQLALGLEIVDWYRDATSVPYGHFLIDLSPRTHDLLRYCTNTGSIPSKFFLSWTGWNSHNFYTMDTQNLSTLQIFQSFFQKCKSLFLQSCPKEFIRNV